jgi:hypothetical protein
MDFLNNKNIRCNSVKSSVLFAVTVPYTKISKEEAYDELKIFCIKLIISKEKHIKQNTYHHHLYFRTSQKFTIDNIKLIISTIYEIESPVLNKKVPIYEEGTIYIGTCRNERQYMKVLSKPSKGFDNTTDILDVKEVKSVSLKRKISDFINKESKKPKVKTKISEKSDHPNQINSKNDDLSWTYDLSSSDESFVSVDSD